jgi:hypothetical protein
MHHTMATRPLQYLKAPFNELTVSVVYDHEACRQLVTSQLKVLKVNEQLSLAQKNPTSFCEAKQFHWSKEVNLSFLEAKRVHWPQKVQPLYLHISENGLLMSRPEWEIT